VVIAFWIYCNVRRGFPARINQYLSLSKEIWPDAGLKPSAYITLGHGRPAIAFSVAPEAAMRAVGLPGQCWIAVLVFAASRPTASLVLRRPERRA
jgi:hypothetical protein